jgi:cytidylate kinase
MPNPLTIAIDGPAASGKSTLAQTLAQRLGFLYFDTGAMYRAVTLAALQRSIPIKDQAAVEKLAQEVSIDLSPPTKQDGRQYDVSLDGQDITWEIRTPEIDANVSDVSAYAAVRSALTEQQRRIGQRGGVVMAGRDIGTVVLPEAGLKIYLDASPEERAKRRYDELIARGDAAVYEDVLNGLRQRDEIDSGRAVAPLRPAEDAIVLQSDGMDRDQVVEFVYKLAQERMES